MSPLVSIGIPVKNGFANRYESKKFTHSKSDINLEKALDSILNQTYKNIEIIISNNGSTDETKMFLEKISKLDNRIKIFNQNPEILPLANFQFVLNNSCGKYFKWNAADDLISKDFIDENVKFLENNSSFTCSSSKFWFESNSNEIFSHNLDQDIYNRINNFFKIRFVSHNIFFGLSKREILIKTVDKSKDYLAIDWMTDLDLLIFGKFKTIDKGYIIIGDKGFSKSDNYLKRKRFNKKIIYKVLPFYELSKDFFKKTFFLKNLSFLQKINLYFNCIKMNISFIKKHRMNKTISRS